LYTHFKEINDLIEQSSKIILTTHIVPDGDAIGSVIAFADYLKLKGKSPVIINHSETPFNLKFLDKKNSIRVFRDNENENRKLISEAEIIFLLDTNEYSRTKSMEEFIRNSSAKKVCIDHHLGLRPEEFTFTVTNTIYPATCQILYEFIKDDDEKFLTREVASALYVGIMTDTGSFRHTRTTSDVFMVCAELINCGADPVQLYDEVYATSTIENLKLSARFIESLEFHFGNKAVIGCVTQKDFNELGLDIQHVEGFTAIMMNILDIKIGVLFVELKDNIKISFRSKGDLDMVKIAKEFGGGGHKNAAGANVKDISLSNLKDSVLKKLSKYLE